MRLVTKTRLRIQSLFGSSRLDHELDEELRYHLDRQVEQNVAAGMSPDDARRASLRQFGGVEQRREECRDARGVSVIESAIQDIRYAFRVLARAPGFTAVAVLSLALGIGANTTIFTFVNGVLLRPLPYPDSNRLVILREQPLGSSDTVSVHPLNFLEWHARARSFSALALVQVIPTNRPGDDGAEQIANVQTTPELFQAFNVNLELGRGFTQEEARPGGPDVVVLSHEFWQRRFGGDPGVLGRRLILAGGDRTIVGVAPAGLAIGSTRPDIYTPLAIDPADPGAIGSRSFDCYGRLKTGVTLGTARAEMLSIWSLLARKYELDRKVGATVFGLHEYLVREGRQALWLLMATVGVVLVIACVNLASLLMARGIARRSELALRASLGASRGRIVRQLVTESLALSSLGGAAGLAVAYWSTRALVTLTDGALSFGSQGPIGLDPTCLAFTLTISTATALVFGLLPAWQASRIEPQTAMRDGARGATAGRRHHKLQGLLVVAEVSLAFVLLVGAGLLLRTFAHLVAVDPGFKAAETITMRLFLGTGEDAERVSLVDRILDRVDALPGVKAAGTIQFLPLAGTTCGTGMWLEGPHQGEASSALLTGCSLVSRGYFDAMGIPIVAGRSFDQRDRADSPRVVLVNQAFAKRYFPDGRVLGHRILVEWSNPALAEIIGIAGDVRHSGLTSDPQPTAFMSHAQTPGYITNLVARTTGNPALQATAIRRAIQDVDRTQAVSGIKTMEEYVAASLARPRLYAALVAAFALIAAILAIIGVYGLMAFVVSERTHEIGIRLALGAARRDVFRAIVVYGVRLALAGLVIGAITALVFRHVVAALLFGVTTGDPVTYVAAGLAFALVALLATAIPAHRASRVDPMTALRYE